MGMLANQDGLKSFTYFIIVNGAFIRSLFPFLY